MPEGLRKKVLRTEEAASLLQRQGKPDKHWHMLLCSEGIIESLADCVENAYCRFSLKKFNAWKPLLEILILHPHAPHEKNEWDKNEWNRAKRELLHEALKSLQGTCLYQEFAATTLTTVAQRFDAAILGVTVGFSAEPNDELVSTLQENLGSSCNQTVLEFVEAKHRGAFRGPDGDEWTKASNELFSPHTQLFRQGTLMARHTSRSTKSVFWLIVSFIEYESCLGETDARAVKWSVDRPLRKHRVAHRARA